MIMLLELHIKNFALIEESGLSLTNGLTALTGETGAGKSLLLEALGLVIGERTDRSLVRHGTDSADIQAIFDIADNAEVKSILSDSDIEFESELMMRRVITKTGRSRAYVNGVLCARALMAKLGGHLVDILSQHGFYRLVKPETHLSVVDEFAGLAGHVAEFRKKWLDIKSLDEQIKVAHQQNESCVERQDLLTFQLNEIEAAGIADRDEERQLTAEIARLRHGATLSATVSNASELLNEADGSVIERLASIERSLTKAAELDTTLGTLVERLNDAIAQLDDVSCELNRYGFEMPCDLCELEKHEGRLSLLRRLMRKHGGSMETLLDKKVALERELNSLESLGQSIDVLMEVRNTKGQILQKQARQLQSARERACRTFVSDVSIQLNKLGMPGARIEIEFLAPQRGLRVEDEYVGPSGLKTLRFLVSTNSGHAVQPIDKVASGGELSRIMLAMKRVMSRTDTASTYVFDEVDAGVGGETGEVIADMLRSIAKDRQVLCVTHLAQVAVRADTHVQVQKHPDRALVRSELTQLDESGRVVEVARMIGGRLGQEHTMRCAEEMLKLTTVAA